MDGKRTHLHDENNTEKINSSSTPREIKTATGQREGKPRAMYNTENNESATQEWNDPCSYLEPG